MFQTLQQVEGLDIKEIKTSLKVPRVEIEGEFVPVWWTVLDIVTKLTTQDIPDIQDWVLQWERDSIVLDIEHIICVDGLSLRKMDLEDLRNTFTLRGSGKLSVKTQTSDIPSLAADFTDLGLKATWLSFLQPAYKIWKRFIWKSQVFWNMSHTSPFWANLHIGWQRVGKFSSITHKWNKYSLQWDEGKFQSKNEIFDGRPVLRSTSELRIADTQWSQLAARLNVPVFGLSRDHARDVVITTESVVQAVNRFWNKVMVALGHSELNLWKISYHTLMEWS